jgi:3-isopropylmalate dehydrogenase
MTDARCTQQKWGTGLVRPEQGLLGLRKGMNAFGNLRPCNFAAQSLVDLSPLKADVCRGTDFIILRELVGGMYFGPDRREPDDELSSAQDVDYYDRPTIERAARLAGYLACQHDSPLAVSSLDKANVLASTGRLWRMVVQAVFDQEFPRVELRHHLVDSAAMLMIKRPTALNGIVLTSNLFGDIVSDEASVIPGSLGLLPSASLCGIPEAGGTVKGIYEPIHGNHLSPPPPALPGFLDPHTKFPQALPQILPARESSTRWARYSRPHSCCATPWDGRRRLWPLSGVSKKSWTVVYGPEI